MKKDDFWWYVIPFCLGIVSLTLTLYGYHERTTTEQAVEEPVKVIKTVATEHNEIEVLVGKIKCVHREHHHNFCSEYVIYRTLEE